MACLETSQGLSSFLLFSMKRSLGERRFWSCLASNTPNQVCTSVFHVLSKMESLSVFQKLAPGSQEERRGLKHEWFKGKAHTRKWSGLENPNSKYGKFKWTVCLGGSRNQLRFLGYNLNLFPLSIAYINMSGCVEWCASYSKDSLKLLELLNLVSVQWYLRAVCVLF